MADLTVGQIPVATDVAQIDDSGIAVDTGNLILSSADTTTAPGVGKIRIAVVNGTTAGTAKILLYAGTSTTPLVLADNIGGGF